MKNNAQEHIQKVKYHADAARRLKKRADAKKLELTEAEQTVQTSTPSGYQKSILSYTSQITSAHSGRAVNQEIPNCPLCSY